jgi:hypothetical protein
VYEELEKQISFAAGFAQIAPFEYGSPDVDKRFA